MAIDLLKESRWSAATSAHDCIVLIGEFGGAPHLVGLPIVGSGDHIVLLAPGAWRSSWESAHEYISHSERLACIQGRMVAKRTKVPVIFLGVPSSIGGDSEVFDGYGGGDFAPFGSRFRKAMPLASVVLGAYRGSRRRARASTALWRAPAPWLPRPPG